MTQPLVFDLQVENKQAIDSINAFFDIYEKGVNGMSKVMSDALGTPVEKKVQLTMEGGKVVAKEVEQVSKEVKAIEVLAKAMNGEWGKTPNALKRQLRVLKAIQGDTRKFNDETGKVTGTWKRLAGLIETAKKKLAEMSSIGGKGGPGGLTEKLIGSQIAADGLMGALRGAAGAMSSFFQTGSEMEVLFIQLQGFTGGVQQAADAYQRFVEIGQATPFTAKEVATAARTMMGFGIETKTAIGQVERLAIVASATGGELTHMARNMGQIQANQKAYTRDLMQFANQGIPIYSEMAKILNVSTQEIREMAEEGEIGFAQVSAALRGMTEEGSAFATIAEKMDNTFQAKTEAIMSSIETLAGSFLAMISEFDNATGGLLSGTLQLFIDGMNHLSGAFSHASANMQRMAPIVAALGAALAALGIASMIRGWTDFTNAIGLLSKATKINTAIQWAQNVALAVGKALAGDWASILLAGAAAAAIAAIAVAANADALEKENAAIEEAKQLGAQDAEIKEDQIFATEGLTKARREHIEALKDEYDAAKEGIENAKKRAQMLVKWSQGELKALKDSQKEKRAIIKEGLKEEKALHKENQSLITADYKERIRLVKEEYKAKLDVIDAELGKLDEKSAAEKEIDRREKLGLQNKLKRLRVGSDEWLQTKVRLEQMAKQEQREKLLTKQSELRAEQESKIDKLQKDKGAAMDAEDQRHEKRKANFEKELEALDEIIEEEKEKVQEMQAVYNNMFEENARARAANHEDAMRQLRDEIALVKQLQIKRDNAVKEATKLGSVQKVQKAQTVAMVGASVILPPRASGGPVAGGSPYMVNELGKEAFLSASGRLSMINAPAFGKWTAPTGGTVIPAHLTSQLDIPAGGININRMPSAGRGGAAQAVAGGDSIMNNVTVQSSNPAKTASDMLVSLTKIRRRRLR